MALDGNGTYSPPAPQFPAIPNTVIYADDFNQIIGNCGAGGEYVPFPSSDMIVSPWYYSAVMPGGFVSPPCVAAFVPRNVAIVVTAA